MFYVYILRSTLYKEQIYIGFTGSLAERLSYHNTGKCEYTTQYKPWKIEMYLAFNDKQQAIDFEKYLKTGSGNSFLKKRFLR